jgi:hypothetical protein
MFDQTSVLLRQDANVDGTDLPVLRALNTAHGCVVPHDLETESGIYRTYALQKLVVRVWFCQSKFIDRL